MELYLKVVPNVHYRQALAALRCSNHSLAIEKDRHNKQYIDKQDRICKLCLESGKYCTENEIHFVLECQTYSYLRQMFIPSYFIQNSNRFSQLMNTKNEITIYNLSKYCFYAFQRRKEMLL